MSLLSRQRYDVAVVGAGVSGCAAALACAGNGERVLLLESAPDAHPGVLGEWIHPPGMDVLEGLGVDLEPPVGYPTGKGFALHPDDGSAPLVLPYRAGRFGFSLERALLVETLRAHVERTDAIELVPGALATRAEGERLAFTVGERAHSVRAGRVALATGAGTRVLALRAFPGSVALTHEERPPTHRYASLLLRHARLPFEGYYHLFVGGPGAAFAYRVGPGALRLTLDVPLGLSVPRAGGDALYEAFAPALAPPLRAAFAAALAEGAPVWTRGRLEPRAPTADPPAGTIARVGEAVGSLPQISCADPTLGLRDAAAFARADSIAAYRRARRRDSRVPETIAVGLSELFSDDAPEIVALRQAAYGMWRTRSDERLRTMSFISGEGESAARFGRSCLRVMLSGASAVAADGVRRRAFGHANRVGIDMARRIGWMFGGSVGLVDRLPDVLRDRLEQRDASRYGRALHSAPRGEVVGLPGGRAAAQAGEALWRGVDALLAQQAEDGSFEGEVVWCPMLAAQYVLACHVMEQPIAEQRRRRLLRHFEDTRLPGGAWGLHEKSKPYLFVTALVYVAARLLGLDKEDPLLAPARRFLRQEGGAVGIPSWGKLWLALVGLYEWEGVAPVLPELWAAPRWLPVHPSRYYCHTRLIYLGMATLYAERASRAPTPTVRAMRDELFVEPYETIDFAAARERLREGDVHAPPSPALKLTYRALKLLDRGLLERGSRASILAEMRARIRYELESTHYTCISPVSGLLGLLALHHGDPDDAHLRRAWDGFEGWIWEDDVEGARVCGARSASWDSAFAAQALAAVAHAEGGTVARRRRLAEGRRAVDRFLASQQIRRGTGREADHDRIDPTGGYCFAGVWHGWPVSDCTAEAMLGRLEAPPGQDLAELARAMTEAARFVLRTQNTDGGFGSYEARRVDLPIDWLNPSEMFGACMTERSYIECTASCIAALARFRARYPDRLGAEIDAAVERAAACLRAQQRPDGAFEGMWGVHFIYGTMFGLRGLLAAGVPPVDPAIRRGCAWLRARQRADGGWGEHFSGVTRGQYVDHEEGQVVQTAWALTALIEAEDPDGPAIDRAARFLAERQREDGTWPKQDPEGIFFHTALLEYRLYRAYFPTWALGLYAQRLAARRARRARPTAALSPHAS